MFKIEFPKSGLMSSMLVKAIIVGVVLRLCLLPLSLPYDADFWSLTIRNIDIGSGLYELEGYYYPPVWGYMLGFVSAVTGFGFQAGDPNSLVYSLYPYLSVEQFSYSPTAPSFAFLISLKIILSAADLFLALITYYLVRDRIGDEKKSVLVFIMVFLSPNVFGSSCIIMMPDILTALFIMLAIFEMYSGKFVLSGAFLAVSVWGKFFPILLVPIMIGFLLAKCGSEISRGIRNVLKMMAGMAVMTVILYYPIIMEGTVADSFNFLTTRVTAYLPSIQLAILGLALFMVFLVWLSRLLMIRLEGSKYVLEDAFMEISLGVLCIPLLIWTHTQYFVTVIPLLAYCAVICERHYVRMWIVLSVAALVTVLTLNTNVTMLNTFVASGLISPDTVLSAFETLHNPIIGDYSTINLLTSFGSLVQKAIAVVLIMAVLVRVFGLNKLFRKSDMQAPS